MAGFVPENGEGTNGGVLVDARLLSDGTLRMLAVVTALETVPTGSRIIIEEFDNGLHPSRAYCKGSRFPRVQRETRDVIAGRGELLVTVPVLFKVANSAP